MAMCRNAVMVVLVYALSSTPRASTQTPYCTGGPGTKPNPSDPILPDISYQSFQAHVEINSILGGTTWDVDQYLDFDGNNGLVKFFNNGMPSSTIFSYNTNEIFTIDSLSHCRVQNLSTSNELPIFGDDITDGRGHIPPAAQALRFGSQFGPVFKGYSTIRGIPTLHWQSCMYFSGRNFNFTLDHYFTETNWTTSSTRVNVPVRIEMQGQQVFTNGSAPRKLHHVYDYFAFRTDTDVDSSVFQTPNNVECPGRKNTQNLPQMPKNYYFRQEMIDVADEMITQADIWYNSDYKLLRFDHRPTSIQPPISNLNPVTEIHDFNYGVRYIRDRVTGNCSVYPMQNGSFDDMMDWQAYQKNHSFILQMKNPIQFFSLNSNYTYSGKRYARDAPCDVYTSVRSDFHVPVMANVNTTFEYYFLSEGWADDPNIGYSSFQSQVPLRLEVTALDVGFSVVYNFLDFDPNSPDLSVFDIADCFPDTGKLYFKVQFPTSKGFNRDRENYFKAKAQLVLMGAMNLSPIRIQNMNLEYDNSNVYLAATLVDKTPSAAQFSYVPGSAIERQDDMVWNNITDFRSCADLCVSSESILCRSFDFCPADGFKCRLSKAHIGDGGVVLKKSVCDHFSRSVNPVTAHEKSISEGYGNLQQQIAQNLLQIQIPEDDGSMKIYNGIDTTVTFGWTDTKPLPSMPEQYSYHIEVVYPAMKMTYEGDVWFDTKYKLVRLDYRDIRAPPPYYSPYTMTYIHDFNTGIAYNIDQVQQNCTITPITSTLNIDGEKNQQDLQNNGALIIQMKGPLEFLHLNYPYRYAGEKTVRGILCDVFESEVPDYHIPTTNYTVKATFQYFFQSSAWRLVADPSTDVTSEQPIMVHITSEEVALFMIYNFYNFDDEDPRMTVFNIKNCFTDDQQHPFMITFNHKYHPYLDTQELLFQREVLQMMSDLTGASPIRFQDLQVNYNLYSVYVIVTLLGQADYILHFTKLQGKHPAHETSKTITNINTIDDCAKVCMMEDTFACNSFDICPSTQTCRLSKFIIDDHSKQPAQTGPNSHICTHYSRSVNGSTQEPSMLHTYDTLKDIIYKQAFQVPIGNGDQEITYIATGVRDDIMMGTPPATTEGEYLSKFKVYHGNVIFMHNDFVLHQLAVDDCATACAMESRFDCQSFDYCYTTGDCLMSKLHPDNNQNLLANHSFCDLYAKKYILDYNKFPGEVLMTTADKTLDQVTTADMCARNCSYTTDFDCKSFDYCPSIMSCRLRKQHVLEVPGTSVVANPICDHYSRNYVYDFSKTSGKVIQGHDDIVVSYVTKGDCAKLCVEQKGMLCSSFEYCGNTTDCRLSTAHPKAKAVTVTGSEYCDLYTRSLIKGSTPYDPNAATHYQYLFKTKDDSGVKAGLAVGMLIVGVVLGVVALFLILRFKPKGKSKFDSLNVHFANKPDE